MPHEGEKQMVCNRWMAALDFLVDVGRIEMEKRKIHTLRRRKRERRESWRKVRPVRLSSETHNGCAPSRASSLTLKMGS